MKKTAICHFMMLVASASNAQTSCPPYQLANPITKDDKAANPAQTLSAPFTTIFLRVTDDTNGRKIVNVTGDTISINEATLGALVKQPAFSDKQISKIRIDARNIVIDGPLSVYDGDIELVADTLEFRPNGSLTILPQTQGTLSITAISIKFPANDYQFIDYRPRELTNSSIDTFPDIQTLLTLKTNKISVGTNQIPDDDALLFLAKQFTLSEFFDFSSKISIAVGANGLEQTYTKLASEANWPKFTVDSWRSQFRINPYSATQNKMLVSAISENDQVIARVADAETQYNLDALRGFITAGSDSYGNGPAWATTFPLSYWLSELEKYSIANGSAANGTKQDAIAATIELLDQLGAQISITPTKILNSASSDLNQLESSYDTTTKKLDDQSTKIDQLTKELDAVQNQFQQRRVVLTNKQAQIKKGKKDRQEVISGLGTAVAVVVTVYSGSPQAGAAAGGVVIAIGNSAEGQPAISSLQQGYQFSQQIKGALEGAKGAADDLRQSRDMYKGFVTSTGATDITIEQQITVQTGNPPTDRVVTRSEALQNLGSQSAKFASSMKGLWDVYANYKPPPSDGSVEIEQDDELIQLGERLRLKLEEIKTASQNLEASQRRAADEQAKLVRLTERIALLKNAKIANEGERRVLMMAALDILQEEFSNFFYVISQIRNISLLEYGEGLTVDNALLLSAVQSEHISATFNPTKSLNDKAVTEEYLSYAKGRSTQVSVLADGVRRAATDQLRQYVQRRGQAPVVSHPTTKIGRGTRSPIQEKKLIASLNKNLQEQYDLVKAFRLGDESAMTRMQNLWAIRYRIPMNVINGATMPDLPVRLMQTRVTAVSLNKKLDDSDLTFNLDVQKVGVFRSKASDSKFSSCVLVDRRDKNSTPDQYAINQSDNLRDIRNFQWPEKNYSFWYLAPGETVPSGGRTMIVNYGPAQADVSIGVRIDPEAAWKSTPVIFDLSIGMEVFQ